MPVPLIDLWTAEIQMRGIAAAAGGDAIAIDNVFHFQRDAVVNTLDKLHVEAAFNTNIAAPILAALNVRYGQTFNTVRMLENCTDMIAQVSRAGAGAITADSMPCECNAFINFRTRYRGKFYRGNKKFAPMSESDSTTTSDVFNAGCLTRLTAIATALLAGFTDSDGNIWKFGVLSRSYSQLVVNPCTVEWNEALSAQVRHNPGEMKKRKTRSVY